MPQEISHLLRPLLLMWKGRKLLLVIPVYVFCKGDHFNDECESFKSLTERKQKLLTQGRCFLCFKAGHTFKDCPSIQRYSYHYCGKRRHHNRAVCPQKFGGQSVEVAQKDAVSDTVAISTDNSNNQPS